MENAGRDVEPGTGYGESDDFGYNVVRHPVHVHDLQATILHLLGVDHEQLTYRHAGRDFRLTDVAGSVVKDILLYAQLARLILSRSSQV